MSLAKLHARVSARLTQDAGAIAPALHAFGSLLIATVWLSEASTAQRPLFALAALACALLSAVARTRTLGLSLAVVLQLARVIGAFPATANHAFLQLILLAIAALLAGGGAAETRAWIGCCRALTAAVLFNAGLQKVLYGTYFDGRMLAVLVSMHERYQLAFEPILGSAEVARLAALNPHLPGQGPFLADSLLFIALANATWVFELLAAGLLLTPLSIAPVLGALLIVLIEVAARETVFGAVMLGALALFMAPRAALRAQWILIGLVALSGAVAYGFLPGREILFLELLP